MSEDSMNDEELDILYRKLIDTFIDAANKQTAHGRCQVSCRTRL